MGQLNFTTLPCLNKITYSDSIPIRSSCGPSKLFIHAIFLGCQMTHQASFFCHRHSSIKDTHKAKVKSSSNPGDAYNFLCRGQALGYIYLHILASYFKIILKI